jgi:hypothetical protein
MEEPSSQPPVASALPSDFEFQYSRDEDDKAAERSLVDDDPSSNDDAEIEVQFI